MQHIWVEHDQCTQLNCSICDGGLAICKVCMSMEGALPTECPGVKMTNEQVEAVYAGTLDYRNGQWIQAASKNSPAAYR